MVTSDEEPSAGERPFLIRILRRLLREPSNPSLRRLKLAELKDKVDGPALSTLKNSGFKEESNGLLCLPLGPKADARCQELLQRLEKTRCSQKVHWKLPSSLLSSACCRVPSFMTLLHIGGLNLCFDDHALKEYKANKQTYNEIFQHAGSAHAACLRRLGQVPIWIHGKNSQLWKYGYQTKLKQDGVDLGNAQDGMAWFGNMQYNTDSDGWRDQHTTVFIIGMEGAILRHPTVFVHELTHTFHSIIGFHNTPRLASVYRKTKAKLPEIFDKFKHCIHNLEQLKTTFVNQEEFLAYMMEAYHCKPRDFSKFGIVYEAPAFPRTLDQMKALDEKCNLCIREACEETLCLNDNNHIDRQNGTQHRDCNNINKVLSNLWSIALVVLLVSVCIRHVMYQ